MSVRLHRIVLACCLLAVLLGSCSGNPHQTVTGQPDSIVQQAQLPEAGLPQFPVDREAAELIDNLINGSDFFEKSSAPLISLSSLSFDVPASSSDYAIYQYPAGDDTLIKLTMDMTLSAGRTPWVALANYTTMRWQFGAPVASGSEVIDLTTGPQYKSPSGNFYFAVIGWDVSSFTINGATVQTDRDLFSVTGVVYDPLDFASVEDVSMFLSPLGMEVLTDIDGNYSFSLLEPGTYTIAPTKAGSGFDPVSIEVTVTDADIIDVNFMIQDLGLPSYSISGNVQYDGGGGLQDVQISISPGGNSVLTDVDGNFSIPGVFNGNYTLTPVLADYDFDPVSINLDVTDADSTGNDFVASDAVTETYSISGSVSVGTSYLQNVAITINPGSHITMTDNSGAYSVSGLAPNSYTVTPSKPGFLFTPASHNVEITNANVTGVNFDAAPDNSGNFNVSGVVQGPPGGLSGAVVTLEPGGYWGTSGAGGGYTVLNVPSGIYTATAAKGGWTITPFTQQVVVADQNVTGINWFASPPL